MTDLTRKPARPSRLGSLSRRGALALPLALSGCGLWHDWFGETKPPIPGKREPVLSTRDPLAVAPNAPKVVLAAPVRNAAWPQAGGNPAHNMGHLAAGHVLREAWEMSVGAGGGYRQKILAQPVVEDGVVYAMDAHARVSAFDLTNGNRRWRVATRSEDSRSTNIGGGVGIAGKIVYAVNGVGDVVALDAAQGKTHWRVNIGAPIRSAPTIVEGRVFFTTIVDELYALDAANGRQLWTYKATNATTALLGEPAPAYANGLVVAGFASGEIATLRAESGTVVWTDSLAASFTGGALLDISSIRGLPVIGQGQVFAIGMGGLAVGIDLPTGRRLWDKRLSGEDTPWIAGDWLFLITSDQKIAAIHAADATVGWATQLPRWKNAKNKKNPLTWFGPVLASDRLVVTGTAGEALSISPYTGAILGRQKLPGSAAPVQPAIAAETLLLLSDDGRLLALR